MNSAQLKRRQRIADLLISMAKKKSTGQRNFYRFVTVIGVVAIWFFINQFLDAAPDLSIAKYHSASTPVAECLQCHVREVENTPIMPHRPMDSCTFCHKPARE